MQASPDKADAEVFNPEQMTTAKALKKLEEMIANGGDKTQLNAILAYLKINGEGEQYKRSYLEIVHTYKDKPKVIIPKIEIPKIIPKADAPKDADTGANI